MRKPHKQNIKSSLLKGRIMACAWKPLHGGLGISDALGEIMEQKAHNLVVKEFIRLYQKLPRPKYLHEYVLEL